MEEENNNDSDPGIITKNISVLPLINSLSPNLRLKIIAPPQTEPDKQKNYSYVIRSLISLDFEDQNIELIIKSYPIGENRKDIKQDIIKIREADPGEERIATNFINLQKDKIRFDHSLGKWLIWNNYFWEIDEKQQIINLIRICVRDTEMPNFKKRSSIIRGVEFIAKSDPLVATISKDWDADPWLFCTPNGTVNLKTGKLRISYPEDQITKSSSVSPEKGEPVLWLKFLWEATKGNQDLIDYLQRMSGYCLTGDISEESLFFLYGEGGNGKGTFINTISAILGSYAVVSPMETFVENKFGQQHPTGLAMLKGARLVTAQETEEGKYWNESQIKTLTGGDEITARLMYEDFFTFHPTFKLVISGNHEPNLKTVDDAIRRRFNKLPFIYKPCPPDPFLKEKLKSEYGKILSWMIAGCLAWQETRLSPPQVVISSTEKYFFDQDLFPQWVEEKLKIDPESSVLYNSLQSSWFDFAKENHQRQGDARLFKSRMEKIPGVVYEKNVKISFSNPTRYARGYKGIRLLNYKQEK